MAFKKDNKIDWEIFDKLFELLDKNKYNSTSNITMAVYKEFIKQKEELTALQVKNQRLEHIIRETLWMARRYADGRMTYAPETVNKCIDETFELGIDLSGPAEEIYAKDGILGSWNPVLKKFEKE